MAIYNIPMAQVPHVAAFAVSTDLGIRLVTRTFTPTEGEVRGDFRERCEQAVATEFKNYTLARQMVLIPAVETNQGIIECIVDFNQTRKV